MKMYMKLSLLMLCVTFVSKGMVPAVERMDLRSFNVDLSQKLWRCHTSEQRISLAVELCKQRRDLLRKNVAAEMIFFCEKTRRLCVRVVTGNVSQSLDKKPAWFNDPAWGRAQLAKNNLGRIIRKLDVPEPDQHFAATDIAQLTGAVGAFEELATQLDKCGQRGLDRISKQPLEVTRKEYRALHAELEDLTNLANYCIKVFGAIPAAQAGNTVDQSQVYKTWTAEKQCNELVSACVLKKELEQCGAPMAVQHAAQENLAQLKNASQGPLSHSCGVCPKFLNGSKEWQTLQRHEHCVSRCVTRLEHDGATALKECQKVLYQAERETKQARDALKGMNAFGFDYSGINRVDYRRVLNSAESQLSAIKGALSGIRHCGVESGAKLIRVTGDPSWLSTEGRQMWDAYVHGPQATITDRYVPDMTVGDIQRVYNGTELEHIHEILARDYVHATRMQQHLDGISATDGKHAFEHTNSRYEARDTAKALGSMIATVEHALDQTPGAQYASVAEIAESMAIQEHADARDAARRDVMGQIVGAVKQTAISQVAVLGVAADSAGQVAALVGPARVSLNAEKQPDVTEVIAVQQTLLFA